MSTADIISYIVSIVSVAVAVWQTIKNNNLKKYIKSDAIELYSETSMLLGSIQTCLQELQAGKSDLATQEAGKAEGMTQALFQRSIKNIYHHFNFTRKKVDEWIEKKKINEVHKNSFLKYAEK